ncbi:hypothetical protein RN001_000603 [Aquatica leii]|uniref:5'-deoxynucleotidase HDDC2 n=1 Tax=Aquatica leii TaxID=1421715 RepID=A0AAN7Q790_9COLE|nr:hypothetical protein RN001_000603 [Aquatica leii]
MDLDPTKVLEFLKLILNLKHNVRKGWEYRSVKNPESIASHMYNMALMTFLLDDNSKLDRLLCLQMALVHDLAECIVGDITPQDNVPPDVKHKLEDEAMKKLTGDLGDETDEAKFVKDLDQFDMILTASEYEVRDGSFGKLQEFFDATEGKFTHPLVKSLVSILNNQRELNKNRVIE